MNSIFSEDGSRIDHFEDSYDDEDDYITFQFESNLISFYYTHFSKYSKLIRNEYLYRDVKNRLPRELHIFQEQYEINSDNIILFFQLLQEKFKINQKLEYKQYIDLYKMSEILQVKRLSTNLIQYFNDQNNDSDFQIQIILHQLKSNNNTEDSQFQVNSQIEELLSSKISDCLQNEKFEKLPISIIFKIVQKASKQQLQSNLLYDFIKKNVTSFHPLFSFLDVEFLSEDRFSELCHFFNDQNGPFRPFLGYLQCNLTYIMKLNEENKNFKAQIECFKQEKIKSIEDFSVMESEKKMIQKKLDGLINEKLRIEQEKNQLQTKLSDSEKEKNQLQTKLSDSEKERNQLQTKLSDSEKERNQLQAKLSDSEKERNQLQAKLSDSEKERNQLQAKLSDSEKERNQLQAKLSNSEQERNQLQTKLSNSEKEKNQLKQDLSEAVKQNDILKEKFEKERPSIEGEIEAKVKSGLIFNADIRLIEKNCKLDTNASKYIISSSREDSLGANVYECGEPITSLNQKTLDISGHPGTYYVRAFVMTTDGKSTEIVSNPVTLSGSCLSFSYEEKASNLLLAAGKYKFEVWGAKGGNSEGSKIDSSPLGRGGLGGYSTGDISLQKCTKLFVYVGGQGKPANPSDGAETNGSFPDGGGTKTGHCRPNSPVPGTGGGSTSIRLVSNSLYTRVIVAGGGGGASGNCWHTDNGGFGGGLSGGNSFRFGKLTDQGAGTQTGSTPGPGDNLVAAGESGKFGHGATGLYKQGRESGGGGGGGWYGGGSGGYGGSCNSASGGGGSGWIFTQSSLSEWRSADSSHASKFQLDSSFYLENASTKNGSDSFKSPRGGNETGHDGDGYAKITPI